MKLYPIFNYSLIYLIFALMSLCGCSCGNEGESSGIKDVTELRELDIERDIVIGDIIDISIDIPQNDTVEDITAEDGNIVDIVYPDTIETDLKIDRWDGDILEEDTIAGDGNHSDSMESDVGKDIIEGDIDGKDISFKDLGNTYSDIVDTDSDSNPGQSGYNPISPHFPNIRTMTTDF
ncbi:MAG: hypothetical protein N2746_04700, partial [Deltaproteobacteria bacterium]|nr:hypothetical protein [Deltaproteobacteria bacterium]